MVAAMIGRTIAMAGGTAVSFAIDDTNDAPACFALGVRKSGSSVFSNITTAIARHNLRNVVDVPHAFFENGLTLADWNRADAIGAVVRPGNVYVGFRDAPDAIFDTPVFREGRAILLVRDPRDALVSEYFSNAYSHSLPKVGDSSVVAIERERALRSDVEAYVLSRIDDLNRTVARYAPILARDNVLIQRYEDVILAKRDWIAAIARHFALAAPAAFVGHVLGWADIRPTTEQPTEFVRKVAPGDHLEKLSAAAITEVNRRLDPVWGKLGYRLG